MLVGPPGSGLVLQAILSASSVILWAVFLYVTLFVLQLSVQEIAMLVIFAVAIPFVALCVSALMRQSQTLRVIKGISGVILAVEFGFLLIPLLILGLLGRIDLVETLLIVGAPLALELLYRVLAIFTARLEGNDRLRGIVVTLGIALFIGGNTLQLLATWL
jgi:hypothetical protein